MFGFLFKILLIAAVVVGVGWYVLNKNHLPLPTSLSQIHPKAGLSQLPLDKNALGQLQKMKPEEILAQASSFLDTLVTHQKPGSPVVLGVNVTNQSLGTLVDVIQSLPKDQLDQLRTALCSTPSGK